MRVLNWPTTSLLVAAALLVGCKGDDADDMAGDATDGTMSSATGETDGEDTTGEGTWEFDDVVGVINGDDDTLSGKRDWLDAPSEADDDLLDWIMPAAAFTGFADGDSVQMLLAGESPERVRFWRNGAPVLGHDVAAVHTEYSFTPGGDDEAFVVEFEDYNRGYTLTLNHLDASGGVVETVDVSVFAAPLIMNHHLQPAEHLWVVDVGSNGAMISTYQNVLGDSFTPVLGSSVGGDVWIQDEIEFATGTSPAGDRINIIIDSIRDRGLNAFPDQIVQPGMFKQTWGNPGQATTFDSFGNLEATPPLTAGGVEYPFGRIYYGKTPQIGLNDTLATFLQSQEVQAPVEIDTNWLCVGHVDEFSTFIPDPSSAKGFKLLFSDVDAGYALLESMDPNTSIPRYQDHGFSTVGEIVDDAALRALNEDARDDYLLPILAQFKAEFELDDSDIYLVPSVFEPVSGCGGGIVALIPGMANLIVANVANQTPVLMIPDPFLRTNNGDQDSDPLIQAFTDGMPAELSSVFVDDWNTYHINLGEVHCGTNVLRTPTANWWEVAGHLLD